MKLTLDQEQNFYGYFKLTLKQALEAWRHGFNVEVAKRKPIKEWFNGDKVILVNNTEGGLWTGVIVDEDCMIHDKYMPVVRDDKTGELIQSMCVFLNNDDEGIMLNALKKLDWNERWNLVSKGRAGIYKKDHYKELN